LVKEDIFLPTEQKVAGKFITFITTMIVFKSIPVNRVILDIRRSSAVEL